MKRLCGPLLSGAILLSAAAPAEIDGGHYGPVQITDPSGPMRGLVILLTDAADPAAVATLTKAGARVVAVNTGTYLARLASIQTQCHRLDWDAESLSKQLQRETGTSTYFQPILAGQGRGATLARKAVEQAPPNTLAGAVVAAPRDDLGLPAPLCPPDKMAGSKIQGFVAPTAPAALVAAILPRLKAPDAANLADLPLIELPSPGADRLAIVLSGDGGWRDLDKSIAEQLHNAGVSVIGWDSLRYFWHRKSPEQTAADLTRVMQTYAARWGIKQFALIGYSFGADVLPFLYNRLPPALQSQVSLVALLGFESAADFEIRVTGWLGLPPSADALPVAPELASIPAQKLTCFYGADETDTACPLLQNHGATLIRTEGSHHFGGNYDRLAHDILREWAK